MYNTADKYHLQDLAGMLPAKVFKKLENNIYRLAI
jgi:hypothetical protein